MLREVRLSLFQACPEPPPIQIFNVAAILTLSGVSYEGQWGTPMLPPPTQHEVVVEDAINQAKTSPARRRRSALNRVDFMLIAATALAFVAIAAANHPYARARNQAHLVPADVSGQVGQVPPDPDVARAHVGAARMTNS
jgi:hypothetical protein